VTMFVVLMAVFSLVFKDPGYKLDLIISLFMWDFFGEGTVAKHRAEHKRAPVWSSSSDPATRTDTGLARSRRRSTQRSAAPGNRVPAVRSDRRSGRLHSVEVSDRLLVYG
jgi:hypothetical protein